VNEMSKEDIGIYAIIVGILAFIGFIIYLAILGFGRLTGWY